MCYPAATLATSHVPPPLKGRQWSLLGPSLKLEPKSFVALFFAPFQVYSNPKAWSRYMITTILGSNIRSKQAYVYVHLHIRIRTCAFVYACTHICRCIYIYTQTYTRSSSPEMFRIVRRDLSGLVYVSPDTTSAG